MTRSLILALLSLAGCGPEYDTVSGTVSGLADGASLDFTFTPDCSDSVWRAAGDCSKTETSTISQNGSFATQLQVPSDAGWTLTVTRQPDGQTCTATGNESDDGSAVRDGVVITCVDDPVVELKGTVTNLAEGSTLVLTATPTNEDLTVTVQGSIAFLQTVTSSDDWTVTIKTQPDGYTCIATDGDSAGYSAANGDAPDGLNFDCATPSM